jgi:hypothetical protein
MKILNPPIPGHEAPPISICSTHTYGDI